MQNKENKKPTPQTQGGAIAGKVVSTISACIIVRNSADVLERALKSIAGVDEIVIVDTGSDDNTIEIAKTYTPNVYEYWGCNQGGLKNGLFMNFSAARNEALKYATKEYILTIDSDEVLEENALAKLRSFKGYALGLQVVNESTGETHIQPRYYKNNPDKIYWERPAHNYLSIDPEFVCDCKIYYGLNRQKEKDPDRTLRILKKWKRNNPRNCTRELYYLGKEYQKRELWRKAIQTYKKYITRSTYAAEKADALLQIGKCYIAVGEVEKATGAFLAAVNINPDFAEAMLFLSEISPEPQRLKWKAKSYVATNHNVLFIRKDRRIKVTILSMMDFAGSGKRIADCVTKHTEGGIDIEAIVIKGGQGSRNFRIPTGVEAALIGERAIEQRLRASDIIHFKGDWLFDGKFYNAKIPPDKKIVYTVSGSFFRRPSKEFTGSVAKPMHPIEAYRGHLLTALTPDLIYSPVWCYMPLPYYDFRYCWKKRGKIRIVHIASDPEKKNTALIVEALKLLEPCRNWVEYIVLSNIRYEASLGVKSTAHIYIDQMNLPIYHNSTVEAWAVGVPVVNWDTGYYQPYGGNPCITPQAQTAKALAETLHSLCNWNTLKQKSEESFEFVKRVHGGMGERWAAKYEWLYNLPVNVRKSECNKIVVHGI